MVDGSWGPTASVGLPVLLPTSLLSLEWLLNGVAVGNGAWKGLGEWKGFVSGAGNMVVVMLAVQELDEAHECNSEGSCS